MSHCPKVFLIPRLGATWVLRWKMAMIDWWCLLRLNWRAIWILPRTSKYLKVFSLLKNFFGVKSEGKSQRLIRLHHENSSFDIVWKNLGTFRRDEQKDHWQDEPMSQQLARVQWILINCQHSKVNLETRHSINIHRYSHMCTTEFSFQWIDHLWRKLNWMELTIRLSTSGEITDEGSSSNAKQTANILTRIVSTAALAA